MTATTAMQEGLQMIPLASINPNVDNPRKHFDEASLKELAASIKAQGVWEPVVVRPDPLKPKTFELVIGERRYRASKIAGKSDIPAIVRNLNDREALEAMILENLQREDVHPIEEARGYQLLMTHHCSKCGSDQGHKINCPNANEVQEETSVDSIAAKIGKSPSYVYARLKLLVLIPAAIDAFSKNLITAGHAVLIARLQPKDQIAALDACFHSYTNDRELKKHDPEKVALDDLDIDPLDDGLLPEKALREWIQDNINLKLKGVPWDLDDANLVPEAGACSTCLKRSTSNPSLFAELAVKGEDTCFDAACFQLKRKAFVQITLENSRAEAKEKNEAIPQTSGESGTPPKLAQPLLQLSEMHAYTKAQPDQAVYRQGQWLPAKPNSCPHVRKGIMVRGEEAGQIKSVCVDHHCKVHKKNLSAEQRSSASNGRNNYEAEEFKLHRAAIRDKKLARSRGMLCQEIVKHVGAKAPVDLLRAITMQFTNRRDETEIASWLLGEKKPLDSKGFNAVIAKADGARLNQILIALFLADQISGWNVNDKEQREQLMRFAKDAGLKDAAKILMAADKAITSAKQCRACGCTEEIPCQYWNDHNHVTCSWKEDDLCSNPACAKYLDRKRSL